MRSGEFSKAMLRRMACNGVKSESMDDGVDRILCGTQSSLKTMVFIKSNSM